MMKIHENAVFEHFSSLQKLSTTAVIFFTLNIKCSEVIIMVVEGSASVSRVVWVSPIMIMSLSQVWCVVGPSAQYGDVTPPRRRPACSRCGATTRS